MIVGSDAQDHHFGGLDQGRSDLALLQAKFAHSIGSYDRGDLLPADGQSHLRHDSFYFDVNDTTDQLIAGADSPELSPSLRQGDPSNRYVQMLVEFTFRYAVMPALCRNGMKFSRVNPALQSGITNSENFGGIARSHQLGTVTQA